MTARTEIVGWIRTLRSNMDTLLGTPSVRLIYLGRAPWNWNAIVKGTFEDGTPILDPATGQSIGE